MPKRATCPEGARFVAGGDDLAAADDTQCPACGDNTFKAGVNNATLCTEQPACGPGEHASADSKAARRSCATCVVGRFQAAATHRHLNCTCPLIPTYPAFIAKLGKNRLCVRVRLLSPDGLATAGANTHKVKKTSNFGHFAAPGPAWNNCRSAPTNAPYTAKMWHTFIFTSLRAPCPCCS